VAASEKAKEITKGIYNAVVNMDEDTVVELSKAALAEGIDAYSVVMDGLAAAMDRVGELYTSQEYFVPELLSCADALYAGLDILKPHIKREEAESKKTIIIGVVEGDIHDIGKNLVKIMFDAAGWVVNDLGNNVSVDTFVEEYQKMQPDIVALSTLMTTSMPAMELIIKIIRQKNSEAVIMVGGAPITREIALEFRADGYAENAGEAVKEAMRISKGR